MPLGIVSDNDLEIEIARLTGIKLVKIEEIHSDARGQEQPLIPEVLKKIVSESAIEDGNKSTNVMVDQLGISRQAMTAYKSGANSCSTYHTPNIELTAHNDKVKNRILVKSRARLLSALNHITPEKLAQEGAKNLSSIAKDMSGVIKNMEPDFQSSMNTNNGVQFIIHAPQVIQERNFEKIVVSE